MSERPKLELSVPDAGITKCFTPAKGSIESQLSLTGSTLDPMRGRFVDENDPKAEAIKHPNGRTKVPPGKHSLEPGHTVFHAGRNKRGIVSKYSVDGKKIEVIFPHGEKALVQIKNLQKV